MAAAAGDPPRLETALDCFDRAIALRESLLQSGDLWQWYNLAGSWMNRGEVLGQLGGTARLNSALAAYDRALALMGNLDRQDDPRFRERLALAHLSRGTTLLQRARPQDLREALRGFAAALAVAEGHASGGTRLIRLIAASARADQADVQARLGLRDSARTVALQAMAAVADQERGDPAFARAGLKARLALCACVAPALASAEARRPELSGTRLLEALDAAEDGLVLSARWPEDSALAVLRLELIRFCAQAYARHQPHFLVEFLHEQGREAGPIAGAALTVAAHRLVSAGLESVHRPGLGRTLAALREVGDAAACA